MFKFKREHPLTQKKYHQKLWLVDQLRYFKIEELFGLDLRSLALFRIGLALLIILDLLGRAQDLEAHYTESGVLPGVFRLANRFSDDWFWSFHSINHTVFFQGFLFFIAGLCAVFLLIGYRTQLFTIISWLFLNSLHNRNLMILNGGDTELRVLLFWSIFLPLGAYYSVDNALNSSSQSLPKRILSGATIALTLQVCFIYCFSAIFKMGSESWEQGFAVYNSLGADFLITPLGAFLRNFPSLLMIFTFATIWLELLGPFLLFIPLKNSFFRYLAVVIFILLHLSFAMVFRIGLFPLIGAIAWLAFLPSDLWNRINKRLKNSKLQGIKIYYAQECKNCQKLLHLLRTFLFLSEIPIIKVENNSKILEVIKPRSCWIIVNEQGHQYSQFKAILYFCRLSPLSKIILPILKLYSRKPNIIKNLNLCKNKYFVDILTNKYLKFHPVSVKSSWVINIITLSLILSVTLWNVATLDSSKVTIPQSVRQILSALDLKQKWNMFASPRNRTGWYVIPDELKNGTKIDVFREGKSINWDRPNLDSAAFKNMRWRKYLTQINQKKHRKRHLYYGRYLCRSWNRQHKGNQQLERFSIYYLTQNTNLKGERSNIKKTKLLNYRCFKK